MFAVLKNIFGDHRGTIMASFAIMLPVVVSSVGMSIDASQAFLVRQRLGGALDASALAAAASSTDPDEIEERVHDFFDANYPEDKIGFTYDIEVEVTDDEVVVSANADYDTSFMRVIGVDHLTVSRETTVNRQVMGLEVVLVLDNTGSMSTNNNIAALREASESFVNILFDRAGDNPESIKIGLVPYANAVRVGRYGLGLNPDGSVYADGEAFVTLPSGVNYTTTLNSSGWYGCVIEYNEDGWNSAITTNDPYPNDVLDNYEGPWEPYRYDVYGRSRSNCGQTCTTDRRGRTTCTDNSCYYPSSNRNTNCPYANVLPMTSDQDELLASITTMQAYGNTLGNIGMAWGYRVLSPEFPFQEGEEWENPRWRKAIIMMTDGDNTRDSYYSAFWRANNNQINVGVGNDHDYDERFVETCDALKEQGVLIYTVTFYSNIDDETKEFYQDCATSPAQYYDAPTQDELIDVFENISRELANLHISS